MERPYDEIEAGLATSGDRATRMRAFVDLAWEHLHACGVSWIGFYLPDGDGQLVLGPSRNKPACSPIGLHGACGRALRAKRPLVVRDVAVLGEDYIACDPRDRAELVIPLFEQDGRCWGVLDVDSFESGAFERRDAERFAALLGAAGLTAVDARLDDPLVL